MENLLAMASNLIAMASNLIAMASKQKSASGGPSAVGEVRLSTLARTRRGWRHAQGSLVFKVDKGSV